MSGTFNAMRLAQEQLKEKYPERTLYTVDTKGITLGSLNIVKEIGEMYRNGASIAQIIAWAEVEVDKFAIYFYADDLKFFGKSGRVSKLAAVAGGILGILWYFCLGQRLYDGCIYIGRSAFFQSILQ
jgi:fatty acid-binding protein DegV